MVCFSFYVSLAEVFMRNSVSSGHVSKVIIFCPWSWKEICPMFSVYIYSTLKPKKISKKEKKIFVLIIFILLFVINFFPAIFCSSVKEVGVYTNIPLYFNLEFYEFVIAWLQNTLRLVGTVSFFKVIHLQSLSFYVL